MSLQLRLLAGAGTLLCAVVAGSTTVDAQARFRALARDGFAVVPNLQIVTIRDSLQDACYLLFVVEAAAPVGRRSTPQPPDIVGAAAQRDRRLAELNYAYEQSLATLYAGIPSNALRFQWEAQNIQSEYERVVRENELASLTEQLERAAAGPRIAVSGPVPCGARAASPPAPTR